jgi:hypothetical protein
MRTGGWSSSGQDVVGVAVVGVAAIVVTSRRSRENNATHRRDN